MSFQEAVNAYVADEIRKRYKKDLAEGDEIVVTSVGFDYDHGYSYSSWTYEDPSFQVQVSYTLNGKPRMLTLWNEETKSMGEFLTGLLAHEEASA